MRHCIFEREDLMCLTNDTSSVSIEESILNASPKAEIFIAKGLEIQQKHSAGCKNKSKEVTADGTLRSAQALIEVYGEAVDSCRRTAFFGENIRDAIKIIKDFLGKS